MLNASPVFYRSAKHLPKACSLFLVVTLVSVCFSTVAQAQLYTGSVTGVVTDPSGAAIASAKVTLTDQNKGFTFNAQTDSNGRYLFRSISPGSYKITVEASGFQTQVQESVRLDVSQNVSIDFAMKIGATASSVEVHGEAVQLQTEDAVTGQVVNRKFINDLPLLDRQFQDLAYLAPGITETDAPNSKSAQGGINFNSNGSRNATADVLIDGASATNFDQNSGIENLPYTPSVDSIEEFKVQQTNFSAEYGFAGGTIINVITRSGTNQLHGSLYEFFRNSVMDANEWFNNANSTPIPPLKRNDFGGTVGGPIKKDKTFFFFDYEGLRERTSASSGGMGVPSQCERGENTAPTATCVGTPSLGNFSELCTLQGGSFNGSGLCSVAAGQLYDPYSSGHSAAIPFNNIGTYASPGAPAGTYPVGAPFGPTPGVPGNLIDPVAQKLFTLFPEPNQTVSTLGDLQNNNYFSSGAAGDSNNQFDIKMDHRFSDRDLLSGRYSHQKQSFTSFNCYGQNGKPSFVDPCSQSLAASSGPGYLTNNDLVINHTHTFSPTVVLTVTYGYVRRFDNFPGIKGEFSNFDSLFSSLGFPQYLNSGFGTIPGILISGYSTGNAGNSLGTAFFSITREGQDAHHLTGAVSWLHGKHDLKFGGEGRMRRINHTNPGWPSGAFNFDNTPTGQPNAQGVTIGGDGLASFLTGIGSLTNSGGGCTPCQQGFNNIVSTQSFQVGEFVQDSYKVTPKLTLNFGLRYEINTPRTERFNRMNYLDPNALSPLQVAGLPPLHGIEVFLNSKNRHNYYTDYKNISPRFGFAYQLPHKFVARGGYGIYFSTPRSGAAGTGPWGYEGYNIQPSWLTTLNNDGVTPWNTLKNTSCIFAAPFTCGVAIPPSTLRTFNSFNDIGQDAVGPIPQISLNTPYEQAWSLGFQKELPGRILIDTTYIGKKGTHLYLGGFRNLDYLPKSVLSMTPTQIGNLWNPAANPFFFDPTMFPPGTACDPTHYICDPSSGLSSSMLPHAYQLMLPYPQFVHFQGDSPPIANSIYHAAQIRVEKQFSAGLQFLMSYTWSKSIDNASSTDDSVVFLGGGYLATGNIIPVQNPYDLRAERAESIFDVPQVLQLSYVYELPVGRGRTFGRQMNSILDAIIGGWQTNGIIRIDNGRPILPLLDSTIFGGNQFKIPTFGQRPILTGTLQRAPGSPEQATNTSGGNYFANPGVLQDTETVAPFTLGNAPRTISSVRQPGARDFSMSLFKEFGLGSLHEGMRLQFRAESFNTFNHPHFGGPNTLVPGPNASNGNFGQITFTLSHARELQLALKLYF